MTTQLTDAIINAWADNKDGPVALHLKQKLVPVEGEGGVIFPPTYADIGYNIDTLSDGTKLATIDSVGAQANRIEPIFKDAPYADLVPQIVIEIENKPKKGEDDEPFTVVRSILDLAHRGADATVYACPTLAPDFTNAFRALKRRGDAGPLCRLAPTSLLFGVWDSRGGSSEKRPRLLRSIIRAWDVDVLHAAAQFNSISKSLDTEDREALKKESKGKKKLSDVGLDDAPATFRKVSEAAAKNMPEYVGGAPNPERRILGGVLARGAIEREVTINLVALRKLEGADSDETKAIRRYVLSLALLAATSDFDLFLREGCHLRFAGEDKWMTVPRRGSPTEIDLTSVAAQQAVREYASQQVISFKPNWPQTLAHKFDLKAAKALLSKKSDEEEEG